jgi:hypothetical protein
MTPAERFLAHRLHEELVWLRLHVRDELTEAEALAYLRDQCGFAHGWCRYATSDYCVLDCPFRPEEGLCAAGS